MSTKMFISETMEANTILRYSLQLAMLSKLLSNELINRSEYEKIRSKLMEKYNVISEISIQSIPHCGVQSTMVNTHSEVQENENS